MSDKPITGSLEDFRDSFSKEPEARTLFRNCPRCGRRCRSKVFARVTERHVRFPFKCDECDFKWKVTPGGDPESDFYLGVDHARKPVNESFFMTCKVCGALVFGKPREEENEWTPSRIDFECDGCGHSWYGPPSYFRCAPFVGTKPDESICPVCGENTEGSWFFDSKANGARAEFACDCGAHWILRRPAGAEDDLPEHVVICPECGNQGSDIETSYEDFRVKSLFCKVCGHRWKKKVRAAKKKRDRLSETHGCPHCKTGKGLRVLSPESPGVGASYRCEDCGHVFTVKLFDGPPIPPADE